MYPPVQPLLLDLEVAGSISANHFTSPSSKLLKRSKNSVYLKAFLIYETPWKILKSKRICFQFMSASRLQTPISLLRHPSRAGQISTEHLKTSIQPFFATCRLLRYPEFWRCYRNRHTFLGPHWKLDNLLTVTMRNTQLLNRP
jgi:hypothetical protein